MSLDVTVVLSGNTYSTYTTANHNYAILGAMDIAGFPHSVPPPASPNVTGVLVYDRTSSFITSSTLLMC